MLRDDNWGARARLGIFIVGNEAVPEAEWWAMAPRGVSVHAARVTARAPWAAWNAGRTAVTLADDMRRGAEQLAAMRLSALTVAHTSSSVVGGAGWDDAAVAALRAIVGTDVRITTNGRDTLAALAACGIRRPFLVLPAWFGDDTVAAAVGYYAGHDAAPASHLRFDPGPGWRNVPPHELYPRGMGMAQEVEPLLAQIKAACPAEADGVLVAGTGFRCVAIIEAAEQALGRPVVTANQASLWRCLRLSGIADPVDGYGRLLRLPGGG